MAEHELLLGLATEIVSAHVRSNDVQADELPALIQQVFNALGTVEEAYAASPRPEPAVPLKQTVKADHLVCLDCGKHFLMLKRHLMTDHKLTPEQYRQRWGLPTSYPIVASNYAKRRSVLAQKIGLGRKGRMERKMAGRSTGRGRGRR